MSGDPSAKQRRAIAALLTARTVQDAARQTGISDRTLRRWMDDLAFREAYSAISRQRLDETVARLRAVATEAVETLRAALQDEHTAYRIRAAVALLDVAVKVEADELRQRIEVLEAAVKGVWQ
jgi:hypothetical protein